MEQELPLQSDSNITINRQSNHVMMSYLWIRLLLIAAAVKSILGLIILFFLLVASVSALIVGVHFRHSHDCPIEPNISLFLIIAGIASVEWIILSFILSIITIVVNHIQSIIIWTLKALDMVQYTDPHMNTFCQQILYQFTLGYLVVTYILSALQCWYRLCIVIFCSIQEP